MRKRTPTGVKGHRRLGIERAEGLREIDRPGESQRKNHGLSFRFGLVVSIQRLHEFLHLAEDRFVRRDHERVGRRIGFDPNRLLTTDVIGPGVVSGSEQPRNLGGVTPRELKHPKRRHVGRLEDVEFTNEGLDGLHLGRVTPNPKTVGRGDDFDGGRRDRPAVADFHRRLDHDAQRHQDFRRLRLADRDHPAHRRRRKQLPCFGQGTFKGLDRFCRAHHFEYSCN